MKLREVLSIAIAVICFSGCANTNSIFRNRTMLSSAWTTEAGIVSLDAKQRVILSKKISGSKLESLIRMCAEPAPDVFSVISSSLAMEGGYTSEAQRSISLKLAQSMSENGSAIRRSQTVNLLAMSMYRTCERYMNGAIDENAFLDQTMRDQRTMVSILAIEQLTSLGQNQAPVSITGGSATSGASSNADLLAKAKTAADGAKDAVDKARNALNEALEPAPDPGSGKAKTCDTITDAEKKSVCQSAKEQSDKADQRLEREEKYYQAMLKSVGSTVTASAVGGTAGPVDLQVGQTLSDSAITKIADTVLQLAKLGVRGDPFDLVCAKMAMDSDGLSPDYFQMLRDCKDNAQSSEVSAAALPTTTASTGTTTTTVVTKALAPLNRKADLFIQVADVLQKEGAYALNQGVKVSINGLRTNSVEVVGPARATKSNQIRYYFDADKAMAAALSQLATDSLGSAPACVKITSNSSKNVKPGLIELWIASNATIDPAKAVSGAMSANGPHPSCK